MTFNMDAFVLMNFKIYYFSNNAFKCVLRNKNVRENKYNQALHSVLSTQFKSMTYSLLL